MGKFMASRSVSLYGSPGVEPLFESKDNFPAREPRVLWPSPQIHFNNIMTAKFSRITLCCKIYHKIIEELLTRTSKSKAKVKDKAKVKFIKPRPGSSMQNI